MATLQPLPLRTYYRHFKSISGAVSGASASLPLISKLVPEHFSSWLFPPLGSIDVPARIAAVVLGVLASYVPYVLTTARSANQPAKAVKIAVICIVLGFCLYLGLWLRFVREIEVPSSGSLITVSVGYARTPFALRTFGETNDWEILRQRGPEEEQIHRLWSFKSLLVARLSLWLAYSLIVTAVGVCFSYGVLRDIYSGS